MNNLKIQDFFKIEAEHRELILTSPIPETSNEFLIQESNPSNDPYNLDLNLLPEKVSIFASPWVPTLRQSGYLSPSQNFRQPEFSKQEAKEQIL